MTNKYLDLCLKEANQLADYGFFITQYERSDDNENFSIKRSDKISKEYLHDEKFDNEKIAYQLDVIITEPFQFEFFKVGMRQKGDRHFEIGVDGFWVEYNDNKFYFLPGDAYVHSIMGMGQLRRYLFQYIDKETCRTTAKFYRFRTKSFLLRNNKLMNLYRGHPEINTITEQEIHKALQYSINHIQQYQNTNGKFLYYYDAANDSHIDHEHPTRDPVKNPYYNILRHVGGAVTLYLTDILNNTYLYQNSIKLAINYLINNTVKYKHEDKDHAYVFYNRKAKLGGTGLALYLLAAYQRYYNDDSNIDMIYCYANQILKQILPTGEFLYYAIYLNKEVTPDQNKKYFSFYYPGEALIGLALFYPLANEEMRELIRQKVKSALHFLLKIRPEIYPKHYTSLPSDSWLMMAINELWEYEEFREESYSNFVFKDADTMVSKLYTAENAPYPDYIGAFYYDYGDYPYADGARSEGLLGALHLAIKINDKERIEKYQFALQLVQIALFRLINTPDSVYFAKDPQKSLGGIRFKYTRQWFRIDTIQHVASFYAKHLKLISTK